MFGNLNCHNLSCTLKAAQNPRRLIFDCGILRSLTLCPYIVKLGHFVSQRHIRFLCEGTTGREQSLDWAELYSLCCLWSDEGRCDEGLCSLTV